MTKINQRRLDKLTEAAEKKGTLVRLSIMFDSKEQLLEHLKEASEREGIAWAAYEETDGERNNPEFDGKSYVLSYADDKDRSQEKRLMPVGTKRKMKGASNA